MPLQYMLELIFKLVKLFLKYKTYNFNILIVVFNVSIFIQQMSEKTVYERKK